MSRELTPRVEFTPESCSEIIHALDMALDRFEVWKLALPPSSRVQEARTILNEAAASGSFELSDEKLREVSAAAALVVDLYHISTCLGEDTNAQVASELRHLFSGGLTEASRQSTPEDFRSQFWVGALLAQSRLNPEILAFDVQGQPRPDYTIRVGGVRFGVEVKRPRTPKAATRAVRNAADQVTGTFSPGVIIVDATDCISVDVLGITNGETSISMRASDEVALLHRNLVTMIEDYPDAGKFSHTALLMTFARFWPWRIEESRRRDAGLCFLANGFPYIWSRDVTALTERIQRSLLEGVRQLTGNEPVVNWKPA